MKVFGLTVPFTKAAVAAIDSSALVPLRYSSGLLGFIRESFAGAWQRNVTIDDNQSLLRCAAVYACISRIATDIAKMRVRLVEQKDGIWNEVVRDSPFWPVLRKPNDYQTRIQFMVAWLTSKLMFGNTYVLKERDTRRVVVAMHVLDPRRVTPLVTTEGDVYYQLGRDDLSRVGSNGVTLPASEIIHDRGVTLWHPLVGVSPLYACAAAGTQGNRIQANSSTFFENMSRPSGILTGPGVINDETAERLKKGWEENFRGGNTGRLAVLGDDLKYYPMTIPAEQAQLIEQLKWTGEDIARAFGVPGYKIGVGPMPTNNNVEALNQQYYDGCLQIHIESIELGLDEGLGLTAVPDRVYGTEFDLDGLLRMDSATMYDALGKAVAAGIMAPNEARAKTNLPSVAGGNSVFMQQQNWSLEQLAKRDIIDDKPAVAAPPVPAAPPAKSDESMFAKFMEALAEQGKAQSAIAADVAALAKMMTPPETEDWSEVMAEFQKEFGPEAELVCG